MSFASRSNRFRMASTGWHAVRMRRRKKKQACRCGGHSKPLTRARHNAFSFRHINCHQRPDHKVRSQPANLANRRVFLSCPRRRHVEPRRRSAPQSASMKGYPSVGSATFLQGRRRPRPCCCRTGTSRRNPWCARSRRASERRFPESHARTRRRWARPCATAPCRVGSPRSRTATPPSVIRPSASPASEKFCRTRGAPRRW
jgi:hypothetical protein